LIAPSVFSGVYFIVIDIGIEEKHGKKSLKMPKV